MKVIFPRILLAAAVMGLGSCKKRVIEIIPVIDVLNDMSIPEYGDITHFSFPTGLTGYAGGPEGGLMKTSDGGISWDPVQTASGAVNDIAFLSEDTGFVIINDMLYKTDNGGDTWLRIGSNTFIELNSEGHIFLGNGGFMGASIRVSYDRGQTFQWEGSVNFYEAFINARAFGNTIYVMGSNNFYEDVIHGLNVENNTTTSIAFDNLTYLENPNDVYAGDLIVAGTGYGGVYSGTKHSSLWRTFYGNAYTYYSVDARNGIALCVGENSIVTNIETGSEEMWNEAFHSDGDGFSQTFYSIRFQDDRTFIVSGSNGTLWRAKI